MADIFLIETENGSFYQIDFASGYAIIKKQKKFVLGFGSKISMVGFLGNSQDETRLFDMLTKQKEALDAIASGNMMGHELIYIDAEIMKTYLKKNMVNYDDWVNVVGKNLGTTSPIVGVYRKIH